MRKDRRLRDRFDVELNKEEREMLTEMQVWLEQTKDATAMKQWAFYGWLSISRPAQHYSYLKEKLLINNKNNKRLGIDVKTEVENKIRQLKAKLHGEM